MQKLLSFWIFILLSVLQVSAAQVEVSTTSPVDGRPEHLYTMVSGNGYYANAVTAPTQTEVNYGQFAFYEVSGKSGAYYIYSYKEQKWLSYNVASGYSNGTGFVKLTDEKPDNAYFKVTNYSGDFWEIQPYTTKGGVDKYLNWFQGIGASNPLDGTITLGLWQDSGANDGGSRWTFSEVEINDYEYTVTAPDGVKVVINGREYGNGETCKNGGALKSSDVKAPEREGEFVVVSVDDVAETILVVYATVPEQPAVDVYQLPVLYPAQQTAVGNAVLTQHGDAYTLSNRVLAASFVKAENRLLFAGGGL